MECQSCGGKLKKTGKSTYECKACGNRFYEATPLQKYWKVEVPVIKLISVLVGTILVLAIVGILIYQIYTAQLVKNASRFCGVFRDFLLEAYQCPVAELSEEDLAELKYLRIERQDGYVFTYSFEEPAPLEGGGSFKEQVAFAEEGVFPNGTRSCLIKNTYGYSGFLPQDVRYFGGVTRLELLTGVWGDYELPKENVIRSITCMDGLSQNRQPKLFQQANSETLEEVIMYAAEKKDLAEFGFLEDIQGVKRLYLQRPVLTEAAFLQGFERLEEVYLEFPVIEHEQVYEILEGILQCPNLKKLTIEGTAGWYIEEADWETLQEKYGERVLLERL